MIAVRALRLVTSRGTAYRQPKEKLDFYNLPDGWMLKDNLPAVDQQHYVMATLVRRRLQRGRLRSPMDHYLDIRVLPDPEFGQVELLQRPYAKLHRVLPSLAQGKVGVSFPTIGAPLGVPASTTAPWPNCLTLRGTGCRGCGTHIQLGEPEPVPQGASFHYYGGRVQAKERSQQASPLGGQGLVAGSHDMLSRRRCLCHAEMRALDPKPDAPLYRTRPSAR